MPLAPPYQAPRSNARARKKGITLEMGHTALVRVIVICGFPIALPSVLIHELRLYPYFSFCIFFLRSSLSFTSDRECYVFSLHYFKPNARAVLVAYRPDRGLDSTDRA